MAVQIDPSSTILGLWSSTQLKMNYDVSAVALYVWDYFITFDLEFDLVWRSKWTLTKYLFLAQRYLPFVDSVILIPYQGFARNITTNQCERLYHVLGWSMVSGICLSEMLLALRVWAVWNREKWLAVVIVLSVGVLWSLSFFYMNRFIESLQFASLPYPELFGCLIMDAPGVLFNFFICVMIWNLGTLIFMLVPGFKAYRAGGNSALFYVVYRDGVTYYLYLLVLSFLNVVAIKIFPPGMHYTFLSLQRCLHTILPSRVLLHIRHHVRYEKEMLSQAAHQLDGDMNRYMRYWNQDPSSSA